MKEQRKKYEKPSTACYSVESEGAFCASVDVKNTEKAKIDKHEIETNFDKESFSNGSWE